MKLILGKIKTKKKKKNKNNDKNENSEIELVKTNYADKPDNLQSALRELKK